MDSTAGLIFFPRWAAPLRVVDQVIAYTLKCRVESLDTATALLAADLHRQHKLATDDAIVYATAMKHGAELLTCDAHFKGLPGAVLFPKAPVR